MKRALAALEDGLGGLLLLALLGLPTWSFAARALGGSAAQAIVLAQHVTLLVAFVGAALAAREGKLLRLATASFKDRFPRWTIPFAAVVACGTTGLLARASFELVLLERAFPTSVADLMPLWPLLCVLPLSFLAIGFRMVADAGEVQTARWLAGLALLVGAAVGGGPLLGLSAWPWITLLAIATLLGAPLFVPLAGSALFLFLSVGEADMPYPGAAVPTEMLQLATSPFLPAIPIFTLVGVLLTDGSARRLLAVFRAFFGWLPGGTAVVATLLCAFFSVFTGGSGVTILALGGLLHQALQEDGYPERFSLGLLTGSGSLGILLPPALPLILFGIAAQVPIEDLFRAGLLPGTLLVVLVAGLAMRAGVRHGIPRVPFRPSEALRAVWVAKYELLLPVVLLALFASGVATLLEAAAITGLYALLVGTVVHREVSLRRDLPRLLRECGALVGGVLIILCAAKGLSSYFVDADVPRILLESVRSVVDSRWSFLLVLNGSLLIVGCFLDVYSATFVVVPLLLELGRAYGVDPVHLGILFLANLELGYLTPPIGLNLFLASYRFERPLLAIARSTVPILLVLGVGVLLITYLPWLTTAFS